VVRAFRVSGDDRTIRGMADEPPEHDELDSVDDVAALRREAASRRRQLRRVEQERHVMIDVIEGYERATARGAAADRLANLEDLELALPLQDMRNATGPSPTRALPLRSTSSWRPVHIGPSRRHLSHRHRPVVATRTSTTGPGSRSRRLSRLRSARRSRGSADSPNEWHLRGCRGAGHHGRSYRPYQRAPAGWQCCLELEVLYDEALARGERARLRCGRLPRRSRCQGTGASSVSSSVFAVSP
jgi:hypothetical protein